MKKTEISVSVETGRIINVGATVAIAKLSQFSQDVAEASRKVFDTGATDVLISIWSQSDVLRAWVRGTLP